MKKLLILVMLPFPVCVHAQIDSTKTTIDTSRGLKGAIQPLKIQPIPEQISFIANGESQVQKLSCREIGYEVNVTPHREEGNK